MILFPWLALVAIVILVAVGMVALAARLWRARRGTPAPFVVGVTSALLVAAPLMLLILAWGLLLKPR